MARYQDDNGYVSMLDPNIFNFQMQLLNKKQQQYDQGYSIALDTKDKYSTFDTDLPDVKGRNSMLDQFTGTVNDLVKSKYNGDWGQASKEVAGLVTRFKQDPAWEGIEYAKKQRAMEDELTARYGPNGLNFNPLKDKSIFGKDGKLLSPKEFGVDVEERLQRLPVMEKLWNELQPKSWSGTSFTTKKLDDGRVINVMVDSQGKEISENMIKGELKNMMEIYKKTPEYKQQIREYTELNGVPKENVEEQIQNELLNVGMARKMKQSDQSVRPYDPNNYTNGQDSGANAGLIPYNSALQENPKLDSAKKILRGNIDNPSKIDASTEEGQIALGIINKVDNMPTFKNVKWVDTKAEERIKQTLPNINMNDLQEIMKATYEDYRYRLDNPEPQEQSLEAPFFSGTSAWYNTSKNGPKGEDPMDNVRNYIKEKHPGVSEDKLEKIVRISRRSLIRNNEEYRQQRRKTINDLSIQELGDFNKQYYTPDLNDKTGRAVQQNIDNINKDLKPGQVTFDTGPLAGKKEKDVIESYSAKGARAKNPSVKAVANDDLTGLSFMIEGPDGEWYPGNLNNIRDEYKYHLALTMGVQNPQYADAASRLIKPGEVIPNFLNGKETRYKYNQTYDNGVVRNAYIDRDGEKDFITVGEMKNINQQLIDNGINILVPFEGQGDDNSPYDFPDKAFMASILSYF